MNIPNRITLDALVRLPIGEIAALPAEDLARLQQEADEALRTAKATCAWLDGALVVKYGDRAKAVRRAANKDFGIARFLDGDVTVVADLPKRVDWDQRELALLVKRIEAEGENPGEYIEIALKVPERNYGSWPSHIRKAFEPARTVRAGNESIKLLIGERGAMTLANLPRGGDRKSDQSANLHFDPAKPATTSSEAARLLNVSARSIDDCGVAS
jgi:hypothetical protein